MAKKAKSSGRRAVKAASAKRGKPRGPTATPLRFAHPFFTTTPVEDRKVSPATNTKSLSRFASEKLGPIPPPTKNPVMELKDIIGQPGTDEIQHAGAIRFHVIGDSGRAGGDITPQEQVAEAMTSDYDPAAGARNPALLIHLGDVIYGHDKSKLYRDEFYRPYMKYPGKIIAIPGNHDGETFEGTDPISLKDFRDNFCAPSATVPSIAGDVRIFRETMTQPGVYWMLAAPFVNIIGLYSNIAEGPGNLLGSKGDDQQIKWLTMIPKDGYRILLFGRGERPVWRAIYDRSKGSTMSIRTKETRQALNGGTRMEFGRTARLECNGKMARYSYGRFALTHKLPIQTMPATPHNYTHANGYRRVRWLE
jgi:Calcineurin-like phosphoesterase